MKNTPDVSCTQTVNIQHKMLELTCIHKSLGDVRVLNGVNLRLESGLVYTLRGGNGSGKSTVLKTIYDLHKNHVTIILVEHKKQLMEDIVNKEIELELGEIK